MTPKNLHLIFPVAVLLAAAVARASSPDPAVAVTLDLGPAGRSVVVHVAGRDAHHRIVRARRIVPVAGRPLEAEAVPVADTGLAARAALAIETPVTAAPGTLLEVRFEVELEDLADGRRDVVVVGGAFEAAADGTLRSVGFEELARRAPAGITLTEAPRVVAPADPAVPSR